MGTIAAGTTSSVTLPAGQAINTIGTGIAVLGAGPWLGQQIPLQNVGKVGPFSFTVSVDFTASAGGISYEIDIEPGDGDVLRSAFGASGVATTTVKPDAMAALAASGVKPPTVRSIVAQRPFTHLPGAIAANTTLVMQHQAKGPFTGFRAWYCNYGTAAATINLAKAAPSATDLADGTGLTWSSLAFGGAASLTMAAATGTGTDGNTTPTLASCDLAFVSSLARTDDATKQPLLQIRSYTSAGGTMSLVPGGTWTSLEAATGYQFASRAPVGDLVTTTTASQPLRASTSSVPQLIEFAYTSPARLIADVGDSRFKGQESTDAAVGWNSVSQRVCVVKQVAAPSFIWSPASFSITGQGHSSSYSTGLAVITSLRPDYLIFSCFSVNDTPTQATIDKAWSETMDMIEQCRRNRVTPIVTTCFTKNALSAGQVAFLSAQNARLLAIRGEVIVADVALAINNTANPTTAINSAYDCGDGVHLNDAGYIAQAACIAAVVPW